MTSRAKKNQISSPIELQEAIAKLTDEVFERIYLAYYKGAKGSLVASTRKEKEKELCRDVFGVGIESLLEVMTAPMREALSLALFNSKSTPFKQKITFGDALVENEVFTSKFYTPTFFLLQPHLSSDCLL